MVEISSILSEYGLNEKEIKIYNLLVGEKELTAYKIAKNSGIHRSTTYDLLDQLIKKGFVTSLIKEGKKYYFANDIKKVISSLKEKEAMLESILPEIIKLKEKTEYKVELLEGVESVRSVDYWIFDLVRRKLVKELFIIGPAYASTAGSGVFIESLIKEFKKLDIKKFNYKGIFDEKFRGTEVVSQYNILGKNKFIEGLIDKTTTVICGDYVFLYFTTDKPYVIKIKNDLVAEEFKSYLILIWKIAKD